MFVGRRVELQKLNSAYNSGKFECIAVYGRKHIGKTALISGFIRDKNAIYFSARELTDRYNLDAFRKTVAEHFATANDSIISWQDALKAISTHIGNRRLVLGDRQLFGCLPYK